MDHRVEIELIANYPSHTGENPLWHPDERCVYWTDIPAGVIYRYDPATGKHGPVHQGRVVGGFTLQADGSLLMFMDAGAVSIWRDGRFRKLIIREIPDERDSRFNDVIADPAGRVFCGTMSVKNDAGQVIRYGKLHRLDPDGTLTTILSQVGTSNGMGFTLDRKFMYHTDSPTKIITQYEYDQTTGRLANGKPVIVVPDGEREGKPDGMTVDAEGNIWSARWDGWGFACHSPTGELLRKIEMPVRRVSSLTFGGDDYTDLYVTTAGGYDRATGGGEFAGSLFRVRGLGVRGLPEFRSQIG